MRRQHSGDEQKSLRKTRTDVRHEHAPAAVAAEAQGVQCVAAGYKNAISQTPKHESCKMNLAQVHLAMQKPSSTQDCSPFCVLGLQQIQVGVPLVPDDLAAREAAHRDDHVCRPSSNESATGAVRFASPARPSSSGFCWRHRKQDAPCLTDLLPRFKVHFEPAGEPDATLHSHKG